jgi:hypothetical protein
MRALIKLKVSLSGQNKKSMHSDVSIGNIVRRSDPTRQAALLDHSEHFARNSEHLDCDNSEHLSFSSEHLEELPQIDKRITKIKKCPKNYINHPCDQGILKRQYSNI